MGLEKRLCYVLSSSPSPRARGFSRACFPRPKNAHSARAISFFLYLFHGKCLAQLDYPCWFLCNHKHIQSFVNSVLIIAKTLSPSLLLSRARLVSRHHTAKERERERKKEKKRYTILIFFSCEEKKKGVHEKKKERKKTWKETEKTLTEKTTQNHHLRSSSFSFSFDIVTKKKSVVSKRLWRRRDR